MDRTSIKAYTPLIIFFAKKYEQTGTLIDREELVQEGWLVLSRCLTKYGEKPKDEFDRLFKVSLRNHLMSLSMHHSSKHSQFVDLDDELENLGYDEFESLYVNEAVSHLFKTLDELPRKVLEQLLEPSPEVLELARIDLLRKRKLKSQGQDVRGTETLQVLDRHIAQHLGLPKTKMTFMRSIIKDAAYEQGLNAC